MLNNKNKNHNSLYNLTQHDRLDVRQLNMRCQTTQHERLRFSQPQQIGQNLYLAIDGIDNDRKYQKNKLKN